MEQLELYGSVFFRYMELYSSGRQPSAFNAYCRDQGLDPRLMRQIIMEKFPDEEIPSGRNSMGRVYLRIYEDFKNLCSEGGQPGPFAAYCRERGVSWARMHYYMKDRGLKVTGLPGYTKLSGHARRPGHTGLPATGSGKYREVPFEDVIFEEAGFLPADSRNAITVKVNGHVAVSFPADTDVAVIARFISKMGKEAGHVGA